MSVENLEGNSVVDPAISDDGKNSVAYETYERTLAQAKKAQAKNKEVQEELNALRAEKDAESKSRLEEQNKYKELYEASEATAKQAREETATLVAAQIITRKKEAVAAHIGAVHKPEFLQFLNLDNIDLDNPDSVIEEATRFKAEYPMVLKTASTPLPNGAAPGTPADLKSKSIADMTDDELARFSATTLLGK
jgi:hypothetical protein